MSHALDIETGAHSIRRQTGFTMIEVLIAAVILAIGVLGIVTLLGVSKIAQHDSIQRTRAVSLADDLLERIRRNPGGIAQYSGHNPLGGASPTATDTDCRTTACDPIDVAKYDLNEWENLLAGSSVTVPDPNDAPVSAAVLRNVSACINFTNDRGSNTGIIDVLIQWRGLRESFDAAEGGTVCGTNWNTEDKPYRRQVLISSFIFDEDDLL